ncbi:hypothetical protein LSCM1_08069 [Leishmania martiniquensis]|uniref:Cytochrome b5 heme-binding domain-containing protein n=1 Tax=Leishmania martiniquensis TaxID=1580590 RepID=A0A836I3H6_9TRYP|nr:hypothetical protein LSCM1_08069 [Leishmania martiniquensis]
MPAATTAAAVAAVPALLSQYYTTDVATGEIIFANTGAFQAYADARKRQHEAEKTNPLMPATPAPCVYIYKGAVYDVTGFTNAHPGGALLMLEYHGKDVTEVFHDEYNFHAHTMSALNMLLQYRVGSVQQVESAMCGELGEYENYRRQELTAYPRITEQDLVYNDFTIRRDRGLVWQVMFLTLPQYMHIISTPIYLPNCRLFDWGLIEFFSRTKHWVVVVLWLPLSAFWTARGVLRDYTQLNPAWGSRFDAFLYYPNMNLVFHNYPAAVRPAMASYIPAGTADPKVIADTQYRHAVAVSLFHPLFVLAFFLSGVGLWTLLEYAIHRLIFHFERTVPRPLFDNPLCKMLHLLLHGIHHIIPMDPDRLVFPPALFVVASAIIYNGCSYLLAGSCLDIVAGGLVCGYVLYDQVHYHLHHRDPTNLYWKDLKKYHHAHHYVDDTRGYGITSKFWDIVFGTVCKKN